MSSILNVLGEGRSALFSFHKTTRAELMAQPRTLADKLEAAGLTIDLSKTAWEGMNIAKAALEEARKIGGPKANAEERMEKAESRIRELRLLARLYAARGDRVKLASLAREAASVARQVGKAASEFSVGMAATTARDEGASSSISFSRSTTLTASSVEMSSSSSSETVLTAVSAAGVDAAATMTTTSSSATLTATSISLTSETSLTVGTGGLSGSSTDESVSEAGSSSIWGAAMARGEAWRARHDEAEAFLRRGRTVLAQVKAIITEAKRAAETDPDEKAREERKKELEEYEKSISDADDSFKEVTASVNGDGSLSPNPSTSSDSTISSAVDSPLSDSTSVSTPSLDTTA